MPPPPFPLTFEPPPTVFGPPPIIRTASISAPARITLNISDNGSADCGAFLTRSVGIIVPEVRSPRTDRLHLTTSFVWTGSFFTSGTLATPGLFANARLFVEVFDERGLFSHSLIVAEKYLHRQSFTYAGGADLIVRGPVADSFSVIISASSFGRVYRIWFDVTAYVFGDGNIPPGRLGGSRATVVLAVDVADISAIQF